MSEMIAIHVPTERDSRRIQEYLFKKGWCWGLNIDSFFSPPTGLCVSISSKYREKQLEYCNKSYYISEGYTVLSVTEFFKREGVNIHQCGAVLCKDCMKDVREHLSF